MIKRKNIRTAKNLGEEIWLHVIESFHKDDTKEAVKQLFNNLLTDFEKDDIARRLAIISLVRQGKSYSEISKKLWVSPVTISSIKKSLISKSGYKSRQDFERERNNKTLKISSNAQSEPSWLDDFFDRIEFLIATFPQISGQRWRFLHCNRTLPKKYWYH